MDEVDEALSPPESRLYTLIDEPRQFALYFLEGQKLIQDLALLHGIRRGGFAYFRDVVLSVQPMIAFLKREEQLGFYIDSDEPLFRLKIEASHGGQMRCALVPEEIETFPERVWGLVRVQKLFPNRTPYTSVLRIEGEPLGTIVNRVLEESYQVPSTVLVSAESDQSAMLHQLPPLSGKESYEYSIEAARERRGLLAEGLERVFARSLVEREEIAAAFAELGFRLLAEKQIAHRCNCSREGMIGTLRTIAEADRAELFDPGEETLEIVCQYCKSRYRITRGDLKQEQQPN